LRIILVNKPFRVLSQFTATDGKRSLADVLHAPGAVPAGRLDYDSEGLLLLTDDGALRARITEPRHRLPKLYWAEVEGEPTPEQLGRLAAGPVLADGPTRPATARLLDGPPVLWPRDPPVRFRARIPTSWVELTLREGRNRQVRRMTASVGLPTLRLVRYRIGPLTVDGLAPGEHRAASAAETAALLGMLEAEAPSGAVRRGARSASRPRAPARSSGAGPRSSGRPGRGPRR
jgi:23S rRNA pseudouridine2457 synthase